MEITTSAGVPVSESNGVLWTNVSLNSGKHMDWLTMAVTRVQTKPCWLYHHRLWKKQLRSTGDRGYRHSTRGQVSEVVMACQQNQNKSITTLKQANIYRSESGIYSQCLKHYCFWPSETAIGSPTTNCIVFAELIRGNRDKSVKLNSNLMGYTLLRATPAFLLKDSKLLSVNFWKTQP
jgi:hypothetical protein